ncbi:MAG: hypothetical protein ABIQ09_08335 [Jatrophihabitantaceae bacterium]
MTTFVGSWADPTFRYTVNAMHDRGVCGPVLDLGQLILAGELSLPLDGGPGEIGLAGERHLLGLPVVMRLIDLSIAAPSESLRDRAEGIQLSLARYLCALPWQQVVGGTWDNSNFSKAYQLTRWRDRAWAVPRSCLTNDPAVALEFVQSVPAIYKGASSSKSWATAFDVDDLDRLPLIRRSPVLFQELVPGIDVRVHVVYDRVFGEAIYSAGCDYRVDKGARFEPLLVPADIAADCVEVARQMKLVLAGLDFKVTADGVWFFLEANSAPCFQGYDRRAGGAISDAIADHLGTSRRR